jgi:hypothetical protein
MMALLTGWLGAKAAKLVAYVGLPLLAVGLVWLSLHLYGQHMYNRGKTTERAAWVAASDKLKAQAAASATKADDASAVRVTNQVAAQAKEQEKVNEAIATGSSPIDVLFGN